MARGGRGGRVGAGNGKKRGHGWQGEIRRGGGEKGVRVGGPLRARGSLQVVAGGDKERQPRDAPKRGKQRRRGDAYGPPGKPSPREELPPRERAREPQGRSRRGVGTGRGREAAGSCEWGAGGRLDG